VKASATLAALLATLALSCVEQVDLAMVPADVTAPDITAPDVTAPDAPLPDITVPDVPVDDVTAPDIPVDDVTADVADARADALGDRPPEPSTLLVQAVLTAQSEAGMPREWQSEIDVTVTRGGAPVTGASVTWNSPLGSVGLSLTEGHFRAARNGYPAWSELTVSAPGERPPAQRWTTPEPHAISSPRAAEVHAALTPLDVVWAPTGAMEAQIVAPATLSPTADTGRATVPGTYFPRDARSVTVRVRRRSAATFGGFAAGSTARTDVTAEASVTVP
jgi:hypothetical protein